MMPSSADTMESRLSAEQRLALVSGVYNRLNANTLEDGLLSSLYHPEAVFEDPFHRLEGLEAIEHYFARLYRSVHSIRFDYGRFWAADESDFLRWQMQFSHPAIAAGKTITVDGGTELHWQGDKVIQHHDFFDGASMLYNHLPLLGWALGKVRERLS
ncbi:nuclear transport factor 2 family protein [Oceanobacter mangrovi]|uniref:nuclear transport factor 2 family protein n=1 Tax=Oceanobacter mangrovi TaxID=2862510 RepID=UPI001C8F1733|nr:nuclear transport factor 2 family protein [Oceanobacter mangrovi]